MNLDIAQIEKIPFGVKLLFWFFAFALIFALVICMAMARSSRLRRISS